MRLPWQPFVAITLVVVVASCAQYETKSESHRHLASIPPDRRPSQLPVVLQAPRDAKPTGTVFVRFEPDVAASKIKELIEAAGGTVIYLVPSVNGAVVTGHKREFPESLISTLVGLKGLTALLPLTYFQPHQPAQWDNSLLNSTDAAGYTGVRFPEAITTFATIPWTSWRPVRVAVIDSGLNANFGQLMEFANVEYYDLCTPEGLSGQRSTTPASIFGHGTMMAGIVAGSNNGVGNNGVVRLLPPGWAVTAVYGTQCESGGLLGDHIIRAMQLITDSPSTEVVLMPFGLGSAGESEKRWMTNFFEPFFRSHYGKDILWVASAGNNNLRSDCDGFLTFPAGMACRLPNVVSVGAFDPSTRMRSPLSNYGNSVTINAPGAGVYTATGPGVYGAIGNTSAAAAMVAGAAGLSAGTRRLFASQIKAALEASAQALSDPQLPQGGLDVAALLASPPTVPLARSTETGSSGGGNTLGNSPFNLAGLAGFSLNYRSDDHHVKKVAAGYMPQVPGATPMLMVELSDHDADDKYDWLVDAQQLPPGTTLHERSGTTSMSLSETLMAPGSIGVPVLTAFSFNFHDDDHHLQNIKVQLRRDVFDRINLTILFEDDYPVKTYTYKVAYALVPPDRVEEIGELSGSATGSHIQFLPATLPVLQGFRLSFVNSDYHIDQIGVRLLPGELRIYYNDNSDEARFSWNVWWANLR